MLSKSTTNCSIILLQAIKENLHWTIPIIHICYASLVNLFLMKNNIHCKFILLAKTPNLILIEDLASDGYISVAYDAENVIATLKPDESQRVFYIDTCGKTGELRHDGQGLFKGYTADFSTIEIFREAQKFAETDITFLLNKIIKPKPENN